MSLLTLWLLFVAAAALALSISIALTLLSAVRVGSRLARRMSAYADLPVFAQAARMPDDIARIEAALAAFPLLVRRLKTALQNNVPFGLVLRLAFRRFPGPTEPRLH
jgi:hypothetical protein